MLAPSSSSSDFYAKKGDDSDALEDALNALLIWGRDENDTNKTITINRLAARFAKSLDAYDLQHFLEWGSRDMLDLLEYTEAMSRRCERQRIIHEPNSGDSRVRAILYRVPAVLLVPHAAALHNAAMAHLPLSPPVLRLSTSRSCSGSDCGRRRFSSGRM